MSEPTTPRVLNRSLQDAKQAKEDEFYTQLGDIERELRHYKAHFKGKVVYCNCDDPRVSNFFHYFSYNFKKLGLSKLVTTCYTPLTGDGDFRNEESIELLKQADIVVTNPPFSLFREYVAQLMEHNKKFLIIGNMNAVTYKEVWPYIQQNRIWPGVTRTGTGQMWFRVNDDFPVKTGQRVGEDGHRYQTIGNSAWFTNLDHSKRHEELTLYKTYEPELYPAYDNYDAIEVAKAVDIPVDWDGVMGVPITFLGKYNPDQFEIVGTTESNDPANGLRMRWYSAQECRGAYLARFGQTGVYDLNASGVVNGVKVFKRILIRRKDTSS